jgi:hypothetical protein
MSRKTYSAVVESGSSSPDYQRWEEREHCGHAHKTIGAAVRCLRKLDTGTNGVWYGATIHDNDERRVEWDPMDAYK